MKAKLLSICLISIIFFISLASPSYSIGVRTKYENLIINIDWQPGLTKEYNYQLATTSPQTMDYDFYKKGDTADIISFNPEILPDVAPGGDPYFNIILTFPEDTEPEPGIHRLRAGVIETKASGGNMGSRSAFEIPINVRVLYPGTYLKASLSAPDVSEGELVEFTLHLENWGKLNISSVKATIRVFDPDNITLNVLDVEGGPIDSAKSVDLRTTLNPINYKTGEYKAVAVVDFDGKQTTSPEHSFRIGALDVTLINFTDTFEPDKINLFEVIIKSGWNRELTDVYAIILIDDQKLQTPTTSLAPWEQKTLKAYWDTTGLVGGKSYETRIILHFNSQTKTELVSVYLVAPPEMPMPITMTDLAILITLVLILVLIVVGFFYIRKRGSGRKRK